MLSPDGPVRWRLLACLAAAAIGSLAALAAVAALFLFGPLPASPETRLAADATRIEDRHGATLYAVADKGTRRFVALDEVSPALRAAVIATEDRSFYQHRGVDPAAVLRAALANLRAGDTVSGGSTIPQQLVRNLYLTPVPSDGEGAARAPRSLGRKAREAVLALRLSRQRSKDEVLALYLNHAYFGNLAYGVEAAAQTYFGRPARELDLAESALLAGLIQAPAAHDPYRYPEAARARQAEVLGLMERAGAVTAAQAEAARAEPLALSATPFRLAAPHFVLWVREQVEAALGPRAAHGGLRVVTTLDLGVQRTAEAAVRRRLAALAEKDVSNAAVVALDPTGGDVLAMAGSADYFDQSIDGAVNLARAPRQPGSAIKPLLYALALEGDVTAATPLADVETAFTTRAGELYTPVNYDLRFHGLVSVRQALANSYNVPAVRLLSRVGIDHFLAVAATAGITSLGERERLDLAVILGGGETSLLELSGAYLALANGGERLPLRAILRVEDAAGRVLWRPRAAAPVRVFSSEAAWLVTDILADNEARTPAFGAASSLLLDRPAAVKTGTSSGFRDNWTVGYTPDLLVGVWVGNADGREMHDVSGVTGAAPIWRDVMEETLSGRPPRAFTRPPSLVQAEVCLPSGMQPTEYCLRRRFEWFKAGTEPREADAYYRPLLVCLATGLPAAGCPAGPIAERVFEFPPEEVIPWARIAGVALAPEMTCAVQGAGCGVQGGSRSDNPAPGAPRLIQPVDGLTVRITPALPPEVQVLTVEALVTGKAPDVLRIEVDGKPVAEMRSAPYRLAWPLAAGVHRFRAVAVRGSVATAGEWVTVTVLGAAALPSPALRADPSPVTTGEGSLHSPFLYHQPSQPSGQVEVGSLKKPLD